MTYSWRFSPMADRHRALGSELEDWNGLGTAWSYDKSQVEEYEAIRTKAGLMDVSGLKKVYVSGTHANHVIQEATTRDIEKIYPGKSAYACMLNDFGKFIDDCILYRTGPNTWMVVHGSGDGHAQLQRSAMGKDVSIRYDDNLHDLSLQGPLAIDFLEKKVPSIRSLRYFHHMNTLLFDRPVMISRTGYTGERGYEIFCRAQDARAIWDQILLEGKEMGIIASRFTTLDMLRVESYLLFFPYDNSQMYPFENEPAGDTLWELGLDFTVSSNKEGFRGACEHYRLKGKERFKIFGLHLEGIQPAAEGATVHKDGCKVGIVTCGMYSTLSKRSLAIARLDVDQAFAGNDVSIQSDGSTIGAKTHALPFYDANKSRRTQVD